MRKILLALTLATLSFGAFNFKDYEEKLNNVPKLPHFVSEDTNYIVHMYGDKSIGLWIWNADLDKYVTADIPQDKLRFVIESLLECIIED